MSKHTSKSEASSSAAPAASESQTQPGSAVSEKEGEKNAPSETPHHSLFSRILAVGGIAVILALYIATLFFAIFDRSETMSLFLASVVCTIVVPVLLYVYNWIYRLLKKDREDKEEQAKKAADTENSIREKAKMESRAE
ncbi:MAG: hypothetical protein LUE29_01865 [Lachnospiraceae bacterium]|nr:hypothetical protein [Lachnospiraceae bacterium]